MAARAIAIRAAGLVCGVGLSAPAACAAIRGAISGFADTSYTDRGGEPLLGSHVPLAGSLRGMARLRRMLAMAVSECVRDIGRATSSVPLLLCVAERNRPGRLPGLVETLHAELEAELDCRFEANESGLIMEGRASVVLALMYARQLIHEKGFPAVIIAAADSFLMRPTLRAFEREERLRTSRNSNGFIPGEAAAAVLVSTSSSSAETELMCVGLGQGIELAHLGATEPLRANGLTKAIDAALSDAGCTLGELDFRITDNSGEQYYFKETALALARLLRVRKEEFDIWHPADCIGEVGAAIGPVILTVALNASRNGYAPGNGVLCHFGNDAGLRGAVVLRSRREG